MGWMGLHWLLPNQRSSQCGCLLHMVRRCCNSLRSAVQEHIRTKLPHNTRPTHVNCLAPRHYLLSNTLSCLKLTHKRRDESLAFILRLIFGCLLIWRNSGGSASLTRILLRGEAIVLWTHW